MAECFYPRQIVLKEPITRKNGSTISMVNVPCNKCENCIRRRRSEWCFRLEEEMKKSKNALFVTLTYNPKKVPWDKYGNMILKPKHLVKFFKKLRINTKRNKKVHIEHLLHNLNQKDKIKYFACGEYGEECGRPHYHAIIFNTTRKLVEKSWGKKGLTHIRPSNSKAIAYVTKYIDKWLNKKQDWKKPKEFQRQSKGIGKDFLNEKTITFYKANLNINFVINQRGIKIPLSRYYNLKIFTKDEYKNKTEVIHDEVNRLIDEKINKLGKEEYYKRQDSKKRYIRKVFNQKTKKRNVD